MPLHEEQCLALYERGVPRHAIDRALLLAAASGADEPWPDTPLGDRDAHLIALRCEWFGPTFEAVQACPACDQLLSLSLDLQQLALKGRDAADVSFVKAAGGRFRRPTTRDLAVIASAGDVDAAARTLVRRLALDGEPDGGWTQSDIESIEQALDAADPLAHVTLGAKCDQCGHAWQAPLDIGASLWDELAAQAREAVLQVHHLASAYGWTEREILSMSLARRQLYLQQVFA